MILADWLRLPDDFRLSWRKLPLVSMTLALLIVLAHLWQAAEDQAIYTRGIAAYHDAGLLPLELAPYTAYVESQLLIYGNRSLEAKYARLLQASGENLTSDLIVQDMLDAPDFVTYLRQEGEDMMAPADFSLWQEKRRTVDAIIADLSHQNLSLSLDDPQPRRLLSFLFVNPSLWIAVFMALGVLLAGFAAERHLGSALFGPLTLSLAMLSGGVISLFLEAGQSHASTFLLLTVVAGLHLGCFWNRFTGLLALLAWLLGLALQDTLASGTLDRPWLLSAVAAGAFLFAFNIVQGYDRLRRKEHDRITRLPPHDNLPQDPAQWPEMFRVRYAEALDCLGRMDFDKARERFNDLQRHYPDNPLVLEALFRLHRYDTDVARRGYWTDKAIAQSIARRQPDKAYGFWHDFLRCGGKPVDLEQDTPVRLTFALLQKEMVSEAEELCRALIQHGSPAPVLKEVLPALIDVLLKHERTIRLSEYEQALSRLT